MVANVHNFKHFIFARVFDFLCFWISMLLLHFSLNLSFIQFPLAQSLVFNWQSFPFVSNTFLSSRNQNILLNIKVRLLIDKSVLFKIEDYFYSILTLFSTLYSIYNALFRWWDTYFHWNTLLRRTQTPNSLKTDILSKK